jgi:hypothetical protein
MSRHGLYDFPHQKPGTVLISRALYWLLKLPPLRRAFIARMKQGSVAPFQEQVAKLAKDSAKK